MHKRPNLEFTPDEQKIVDAYFTMLEKIEKKYPKKFLVIREKYKSVYAKALYRVRKVTPDQQAEFARRAVKVSLQNRKSK